jgi:hypothetical protein
MGYVIAVILVLLLVAAFVTFMVLNATKKGGRAGPSDPGGEGSPAGIVAPDESPLGDTAEHSGEQTGGESHVSEGESVPGPSAEPPRGGSGGVPTGGEGEGGEQTAPQPASERLSDRPR